MRHRPAVGLLVLVMCACTHEGSPTVAAVATTASSSTSTTTAPPLTTTSPTTAPPAPLPTSTTTTPTPATTTVPPSTTTSTLPAGAVRVVTDEAYTPFATVGGITLLHPANRVEHVGFHESNNDGARQQTVLPTAVSPIVLPTRDRGTGSMTAADVVVDPDAEIRSPVTGTVVRAGTYTLYCDYRDDYVVIDPDDHPGWEVKVLHIVDETVSAGDPVVAGETVIAPHAHQLPFASEVDDDRTADPAWPHVHVEVVDPTIPDRPGEPCP